MEAFEAATIDLEDIEADSYDEDETYSDEYAQPNTNEILSPLDESDIVKCNICSENVIRTVMQEHRVAQHSACKCIVCEEEYPKQSALLDHLRSKHMDTWDSLECQFCSKVVTRKSNLLQHILYRHSAVHSDHSLKQSNQPSTEAKDSSDHGKPHNEPLRHECSVCHKKVVNLQTHMTIHNRSYNCDSCSNSFDTEERLNVHKEMHQRDGFSCRHCNLKYSSSDSLYKHIKSIHTGVRYRCPVCGSKFNRRDNMVKHANRMHGYSVDGRKHIK